MKAGNKTLGVRLRIVIATDVAIGPGKADLLEAIQKTGSISAAGRSMGMSYKRAWLLVEALNSHFKMPLVEAAKGGHTGGGAHLTELGTEILGAFRDMEKLTAAAVAPVMRRLTRKMKSR